MNNIDDQDHVPTDLLKRLADRKVKHQTDDFKNELNQLSIGVENNIASVQNRALGYKVEANIQEAGCPANVVRQLIDEAFKSGYSTGSYNIQSGIKNLLNI